MKEMTALVRKADGNLKIFRDNTYSSQKFYAEDLRGNGFRVLKIWSGNVSDNDVEMWEFLNR